MHDIIQNIIHAPASSWYHLAAFILTGAGAQYSVQLVKVVSKNKYGKGVLRFLNGLFSTLYVGAGALIAGGVGVGEGAKTAAAVTAVSVLIYRIHNSFLYKSAENLVNEATDKPITQTTANGAVYSVPPVTPSSSFTGN